MSKKEVLKKTTAFLAALSFLMTNQNQCIYLMAEEITTPNTKVENSASTTTVSKKDNNVTTTTVNTPSDTTMYTEPTVTTAPAITETIATTVPTEMITVTTTPAPKYVYNFTFIGDSFKDNKELIITAIKSIGIKEEYIEITENNAQAKLYNRLSRPSKDVRAIGSIYAKSEMSGYNITFTEYTLFSFNFVGTNIEKNKTNQRLLMESLGIYDIDWNNTDYAILKSDFGKDFDYNKLIYTRSGRKAKVELKENVFSFTEYYDISPVMEYIDVPESIINNHVPYNTELSLKEYYRFEDANTKKITVKSDLNYKDYKISEKTYSVEFESGNYKVGGQNPETKKYSWLKDKSNTYNIHCEGEYIKSVTIYDGETAVYTEDFSDSMSDSCDITFSTENLELEIVDNKVFTVKVDTIPKTVSVPLYFFNPETNEWEHNDKTDYRTFEVANNGTITVPQRIQDENNVDKAILIESVEGMLSKDLPQLKEIMEKILPNNPNFNYTPSMMLCYYSLKQTGGFDFEDNVSKGNTLKYINDVFIRKMSDYIVLMELANTSSIEYITMDYIFDNDMWNYKLKPLPTDTGKSWESRLDSFYSPTFLNITGIIDDSGNNYLDSNKYIYLDAHAPRFDLSTEKTHPTGTNTKGEVWTNSNFKFDITVDDRFSVSANDFGEELHNQLDGITSKTGKVIITDEAGNTHTFTKNSDGTVSHTVTAPATAEGTVPEEAPALNYSIEYESITDNADNTETLRFYVSTDETLFVQNFTVSVEDGVGNPSAESKTITARIEKTAPVVTSAEIRGFVENSNTIVSRKDGKKGSVVLSGEFSDGDSGIKEIRAVPVSDKSTTTVTPETIGKSDKFSFTFSNDPAEGDKAKLKITVTDFAGNTSEVIYSGDAENLLIPEGGAEVIFDNTTPEVGMHIFGNAIYTKEEKEWYKDFPDIELLLRDLNTTSGINEIFITVNGTKLAPVKYEGKNVNITPDMYSKYTKENGEIKIEAYCTDTAGNKGKSSNVIFYVDDKKPSVAETFDVKTQNAQLRKFGTFYNAPIDIAIDIADDQLHSSALQKAVIELIGTEDISEEYSDCQNKNKDTAKFRFEHSKNKNKDYWIISNIISFDNVNNESENKSVSSKEGSNLIMIETSAPKIAVDNKNIVQTDEFGDWFSYYYTDEYDNKWYSGDVEITFDVTDSDSGIWKANITRETYEGVNNITNDMKPTITETLLGEDANGIDYSKLDKMTTSDTYTVSTRSGSATSKDGAFVFSIEAYDNATNKNSKINGNTEKITVYKDITAPEITGFIIDEKEEEGKKKEYDKVFPFLHFKNTEKEVTVIAKDKNASSGINKITVYLTNPDGSAFKTISGNPDKYEENGEVYYTYTVIVPEGFKGDISASVTDNVGNSSEEKKYTNAYVSENLERHELTSSIDIKLPETTYTDRNGTILYNKNIDAQLIASDKHSGISEVLIKATDYGDSEKKATIDTDGNLHDSDNIWKEIATDENNRNLINDISGTVKMSSNENGNTVSLQMTDNSGNTSSVEKHFSIDKTAPEISVSFDNNSPDQTYTDIYNADRKATVKIKERNFDPAKVTVTPACSNTEWVLVEGVENTDSAVYQSVLTFNEDGKHSFTIDCTDMADNKATQYQSPEFIIDKTSPSLEVTYDNQSNQNDNYYASKRTATIKITETNFDPERIKITGTKDGKAEDFPKITGWTSNGDVHTTTVLFEKDGYYTVEVKGNDKAGNGIQETFSETFHIDTLAPDIKINGVENEKAYNGDVIPSVTITDTNLDTESVAVSVTGVKTGENNKLKNTVTKENGKVTIDFEGFPKTQNFDDIYNISVTAKDKSGNDIKAEKKFSVNRFGSTFELDKATSALNKNYTTTPQDVVIREINVNSHKKDFTPILTLAKDGRGKTLVQGEHYELVENNNPDDWADYEYIIFAENFADDAVYELSMYTEDEAGNRNNTAAPLKETPDISNVLLTFGVDKTRPKVNFLNAEENGSYRADSMEFKVLVEDNIMVRNVEVYVNNIKRDPESYTYDPETQQCTFKVASSEEAQRIEVVPFDMAGNVPETDDTVIDNVLVSPSFARILVHKKWFKFAVVGAVAAIAGAVGFVVKRKKKLR